MDKRYRYFLLSNDTGESLELKNAPQGWDANKLNFVRDLTYIGILKSISVEFQFVGDGFEFLQRHRLRLGWDANILFRCYKVKGNKFQYEGKVNMVAGSENRKPGTFKIDIVQSSAVQNFQNRQDTQVNILNSLSMDRQMVTPAYLRPATVRGKRILFNSVFDGSLTDEPSIYHHSIPFAPKSNGNADVQASADVLIDTWVTDSLIIEDATNNPMYENEDQIYKNGLLQQQTLNVKAHVDFTAVFAGTASGGSITNYIVYRIVKLNADNTLQTQLLYKIYSILSGSFTLSFDYADTLTFEPGEQLIFVCERWGKSIPVGATTPLDTAEMQVDLKTEITYNQLTLEINQDSIVDDSTTEVTLPHELFANLVGQICNCTINAPIFGRVDLGYAEDGAGAYISTTLGAWLRKIDPTEANYSTSFRDAFKSYSSILCLGVQIVDNVVYIDTLDKLFNYNIAANLGEVEDFQVQALTEFLFNSVKAGYPSNEYEQENGRDEINTTYQYSNSFASIKKELDLTSVFCGDGYGVEFARRAGIINTGTSDSRYDDKIFFLDLIKDIDGNLITRRLEGILLLEGVFSPETMINANLAVGQNVLRWRKYLNIPLDKKSNKVLFFQSKDKNQGLRMITELGETNDGEDIQLGYEYLFLPDAHLYNCPITTDNLNGIIANPNGVIQYSYGKETFFDFIMGVDVETDKRATKWRMIATKSTPPDEEANPDYGPYIKYDDGLTDFVKHNDGSTDFIKYAD